MITFLYLICTFRNLQEGLRPFAQFHNCREFEHLVYNLVKEKELKHRVAELYKYRKQGIRRIEECAEFERLKGNVGSLRGNKRSLDTIHESENQEVINLFIVITIKN